MVIRLDENYNAMTSTALLGYVGETNARPVSVEGMEIDGADRYVLTIDYGDGTVYEVDITGGQWTPTADILRSAQTVSCQIAATKLSGDEYVLVKKSRMFRLRIGAAIGDNAVPSPSVATDALDRIDAIGKQAHADMQTAVTAAETATTSAENAKKSATAAEKSADTATQAASRAETAKASAETAAQKAQSIADSLPDDYTTAVGKIAENTAEIANVKLTDKELQRRVNALYDLGNGVTHQFETDSETAYAKTVPTGAKLMSVKSVGGRSIVFNQFAKNKPFDSRNGITTSTNGNYSVLDGTATNAITAKGWWGLKLDEFSPTNGHKYLFCSKIISGTVNPANGCTIGTAIQKQIVGKSFIFEMSDKHWDSNWLSAIYSDKDTVFNKLKISVMLIDLTLMFGSGNEPSTVEEFEKMFPADYYPYAVGEIVSAGTEEAVVGDTAHPIPEAIRNLPGYGWSAGTARNYVDYENKKYVQCVNSVDLGTKNWWMYKDGDYTPFFYLNAVSDIRGGTSNFLCPKYQYVKIGVTDSASGLYVLENTTVRVRDTAYTDAVTFKQAMQGVILYYELANPIITDISTLIDDDFLRNLTVEAGGSITFKNSNDSYRIPVPSEEEYIVKLSEVGGSV